MSEPSLAALSCVWVVSLQGGEGGTHNTYNVLKLWQINSISKGNRINIVFINHNIFLRGGLHVKTPCIRGSIT